MQAELHAPFVATQQWHIQYSAQTNLVVVQLIGGYNHLYVLAVYLAVFKHPYLPKLIIWLSHILLKHLNSFSKVQ